MGFASGSQLGEVKLVPLLDSCQIRCHCLPPPLPVLGNNQEKVTRVWETIVSGIDKTFFF